jgi:hypothetical protein
MISSGRRRLLLTALWLLVGYVVSGLTVALYRTFFS